jgi:GNAT superfamily N-acetyltransferase
MLRGPAQADGKQWSRDMQSIEWTRERFTVTTDPARLDLRVVAETLGSSYWAAGIPLDTVARSVASSLCFSLLDEQRQIGFARVISDYATVAYLSDVFILPSHRGLGLSKWLMTCIVSHPELQGLRRWLLATRDAHGLYRQFGFEPLANPQLFMERHDPNVYRVS